MVRLGPIERFAKPQHLKRLAYGPGPITVTRAANFSVLAFTSRAAKLRHFPRPRMVRAAGNLAAYRTEDGGQVVHARIALG